MESVALIACLIAGALLALYIQVRRFPTKPCRRCNGTGERRDRSGRSIGTCPRCKNKEGRVKRPRILAKMFGVAR